MKTDLYERSEIKIYEVIINGVSISVSAQSLGEALRKFSNIRLDDDDVIMVRLAK